MGMSVSVLTGSVSAFSGAFGFAEFEAFATCGLAINETDASGDWVVTSSDLGMIEDRDNTGCGGWTLAF